MEAEEFLFSFVFSVLPQNACDGISSLLALWLFLQRYCFNAFLYVSQISVYTETLNEVGSDFWISSLLKQDPKEHTAQESILLQRRIPWVYLQTSTNTLISKPKMKGSISFKFCRCMTEDPIISSFSLKKKKNKSAACVFFLSFFFFLSCAHCTMENYFSTVSEELHFVSQGHPSSCFQKQTAQVFQQHSEHTQFSWD